MADIRGLTRLLNAEVNAHANLQMDLRLALGCPDDGVPFDKAVKKLVAESESWRKLVREICERRELSPCWYDDESDCGNWPHCYHECPLRQMRELGGIVPQKDGGMDKQPAATPTEPSDGRHETTRG